MRLDATPREVHYGLVSERTRRALRAGELPADRLWRPGVRAISLARFAIFVTVAGWIAFTVTTLAKAFFGGRLSIRYAVDAVLYIGVTTLLTASALAYLLARLGALYRARKHHRAGRVEIDRSFDGDPPSLTVLVPSYCEETDVIRQTLLTTALQEYPGLRIVLLLDDPPHPSDAQQLELLENARALPAQLAERLRERASASPPRTRRSSPPAPTGRSTSRRCARSRGSTSPHGSTCYGWPTTTARGPTPLSSLDAPSTTRWPTTTGGSPRPSTRRPAKTPTSRRCGSHISTAGSRGRSRRGSSASSGRPTSRCRTRRTRP